MLRLEIQLILVDFCPSALRMHGPFLKKNIQYGWLTDTFQGTRTQCYLNKTLSLSNFLRSVFRAAKCFPRNEFYSRNHGLEDVYISPPASKNCYFLYYLFLKFSGSSKRSQIPPILGEIIWQVWELIPDLHSNPPPAFQNVRKKTHNKKQQLLGCCYEFLTSHVLDLPKKSVPQVGTMITQGIDTLLH